jgi:hypothetical protein
MDLRIALSPVLLSCPNMRRMQYIRRTAVHVTSAGTTIAAHRSATATMSRYKDRSDPATVSANILIQKRKDQPE